MYGYRKQIGSYVWTCENFLLRSNFGEALIFFLLWGIEFFGGMIFGYEKNFGHGKIFLTCDFFFWHGKKFFWTWNFGHGIMS